MLPCQNNQKDSQQRPLGRLGGRGFVRILQERLGHEGVIARMLVPGIDPGFIAII
jgi:hypothetical protein